MATLLEMQMLNLIWSNAFGGISRREANLVDLERRMSEFLATKRMSSSAERLMAVCRQKDAVRDELALIQNNE